MSLLHSRALLITGISGLTFLVGASFFHREEGNFPNHSKPEPQSVVLHGTSFKKINSLFSEPSREALRPEMMPEIAAPLDHPSEQELKDFPGARVVEFSEIEGPEAGQKIRMRVLETDFKYPYVRTEELVDPSTGALLGRAEMAADHFLLTLPEGETAQEVLDGFGPDVLSMKQVSANAPLYLVQLAGPSLQTLPVILEQLEHRFSASVGEPDYFSKLTDPDPISNINFNTNQWALDKISAPNAWGTRSSAAPIIVAIIDTGIRYTHEDLKNNMWHNPMPLFGDLYGVNASVKEGDSLQGDPMDDNGHGTHCAGIIGAEGINQKVSGIARKVQLMACKYMDERGKGLVSDEITCINYAIDHGATIFNCSYGVEIGFRKGGFSVSTPFSYSSQFEYNALKRARDNGVIVVAAAGNNATSNDQYPSYPASYDLDNIVVVAATNNQDQLSYFSNYGKKSVHLAAPGENILSTWAYSDTAYTFLSGTSMATPHVTGALALMAAQFPKLSYQELIARLLAATDKIPALEGKTQAGRLNLSRALSQQ